MANITDSSLRGLCPAPFYDESKFGFDGAVGARFCAPIPQLAPGLKCCLPCPATDYLYPQDFKTWYRVAEALNLAGLVLMLFLLLSFAVLPPESTRRHYLSYCLIIGCIFLALGFVVPFGARPEQCFDEVTPNDMYTSLTCAFSGAFIIAGGLSIGVWIFIRALSMHLQICWDIIPGKRFFYWAQGLGWSVAAAIFTITITATGVSFRFGEVCHVNASHSTIDFWGPLLVIAGGATLIQLGTFAYCIKVYIQSMWNDSQTETQSSMGLPSYTNSVKTVSPRAVYRRVRKVVYLQWRGITIVVFILVDVIFFSVVFIWLNNVAEHALNDIQVAMPFLLCLLENATSHEQCTPLAEKLFVNKSTVIAILVMLSIAGLQCFLLLARASMFTAWADLFRQNFGSKREFVSLDAHKYAVGNDQFELAKVTPTIATFPEIPPSALTSPIASPTSPTYGEEKEDFSIYRRSATGTPDFLHKRTTREYTTPTLSFSTPHAPSHAPPRVEWDPRSSNARGGLGLHPPERGDDSEEDEPKR